MRKTRGFAHQWRDAQARPATATQTSHIYDTSDGTDRPMVIFGVGRDAASQSKPPHASGAPHAGQCATAPPTSSTVAPASHSGHSTTTETSQ